MFFVAQGKECHGRERITGCARRERGIRVMSMRRTGRMAWAGILLAAGLTSNALAAEIPIKFTLNFKIEAPAAPFLLPLDKGYYKTEGLNVAIDPATGPAEAIKRVASGSYDMGVADINALIRFRDSNPDVPIKAVFIVYNRPPFAVIGRKSRGISAPKDLEGKKLGAPAAGIAFAQWPIFAQVNGIDTTKVAIENVAFPVRDPMLAAGQLDAITGISYNSFLDLKGKGVPVNDIVLLLMADYGVSLYGNAIFVNPKFAEKHPEAVKGFLRAFLKGLKETVQTPVIAVGSVLERNDTAKRETEVERLRMAIRDNIVTAEVKENGYGGIDRLRFAKAIDQIAIAYKFKSAKPKPEDIFDDSYLPASTGRKVN
jgi:NitT/TauT family transport system substrate-binding protein